MTQQHHKKTNRPQNHRIVFITLPGFQSLDLFGPFEVFTAANSFQAQAYDLTIAALSDGAITSESGPKILPDLAISDDLSAETIVFCGGCGARENDLTDEQISLLQHISNKADRIVGICTGSFLLAKLGLLEGRHAATHWAYTGDLQENHQQITVDENALYINDGNIWTSAGVTAGIDLSLAIVEQDLGSVIASSIARYLVVYMRRIGGQAQFSQSLKAQSNVSNRLSPVLNWLIDNLDKQISVEKMANHAGLSARQFIRLFNQEMKQSPAKYLEALKLDKARNLLADKQSRIEIVAKTVGYRSIQSFRRAFIRKYDICPSHYQNQFYHTE